jgi:hypothetical protein
MLSWPRGYQTVGTILVLLLEIYSQSEHCIYYIYCPDWMILEYSKETRHFYVCQA